MTYPPITASGEQASAQVALRLRRRSRRGSLLSVWNDARQSSVVAERLAQSWGVSEEEAMRGLELAARPTPHARLRELAR